MCKFPDVRPFIVTTLSHMSPFATIPPPYAFSIHRPLPTCTLYLSVISMPDPPIRSALIPDPTPIHTEYLHQTSPRTYTILRIGPPLSLPPSVPMLYLLLVSSLSIAYLRPFIITMLPHMSPFVTIPPPYAFSILRPLPTCTSYLPTCFSILTSDPRSERHSMYISPLYSAFVLQFVYQLSLPSSHSKSSFVPPLPSVPLHLRPSEIKDNDLGKGVTHKSTPSPY